MVVSQLPPTTTMCAQALSAEEVPEQHPMDRPEGVPWEELQEVEMQMASGESEPSATAEPSKRDTLPGTGGKGSARATEATSGQQESPGALHKGVQKSGTQDPQAMLLEPRGAEPWGSTLGVLWARVVVEGDTVGTASRGLASFPLERGRGTEKIKQVADAVRSGSLAARLSLEARVEDTWPGNQVGDPVQDRAPKEGSGTVPGRTRWGTRVGQLPLDLPDEVLFQVLARVPILEPGVGCCDKGSAADLLLPSALCCLTWPVRQSTGPVI
jgi:hypothetical protein